jgi:hypothetical protein
MPLPCWYAIQAPEALAGAVVASGGWIVDGATVVWAAAVDTTTNVEPVAEG